MSKFELYQTSEKMKLQEDAIYEEYRVKARRLLKEHNAEDLLPMLGLDDEHNA